ncbi:serine/threonine-protein kinase [Paraliomyxa miuraensis]|uniref:serine/threonine-protein kinase n=1 Tax=Paraliomyxa miuraensis TaxID=376150 RepID=UPI00225C2F59|nr:serine/threonine-protein kinase [Paraliomyxa miuraensis]MCX4241502.1 protein kinase [Paraliomyxa miuraensis]
MVGAILEPGSVVAERFEVGEIIDSGGMGSVYRATDLLDDRRPIALKVIRDQPTPHSSQTGEPPEPGTSLDTQQLLDSFQREAELLANLRHPSIVRYVHHGRTSSGAPYLAMEWVEGEDLKSKLRREPLTVAQTLRLGLRLAEGLAAAHRVGVIHRDIKPSNILLPDGNVDQAKIADFGIAQFTQFVLIRGGTPGYMAPELHLERSQIDARADVYSLGLLLTRCLSTTESRPSLQGSEDLPTATVVEKSSSAQVVDGTTLGLSVPNELDELLRRMLSTDRSLRPAHGGVVASHLQALASRLDPDDTSVLSAQEKQLVGLIRVELDPRAHPSRDAVAEVLSKFGATQRVLGLLSLVITLESRISEGDHTLRTALCALEVRRVCPTARLALVLGQIPPQTQQSLITAAERLLDQDEPTSDDEGEHPILIDPRAANLLDVRFDVERTDAVCRLLRPRRELAAGRLLLGKPSPWVGRTGDVDRLLLTYLDAVATRRPRAVVMQAEAGMGKSRLVQELLSGLEASNTPPLVWIARGDPVSAGSPFALLAQLVHAMAGIAEGESMAIRQSKLHRRLSEYFQGTELRRVEAFLGELSRTPYPNEFCLPLVIARQDPQYMAEQTRRAWEDLIAVASSKQSLVIVLDDCQWGDLATLRYFDHALRSTATGALTLLVLARPGASPWAALEGTPGFSRFQLERLSASDCAAFLQEVLGDDLSPKLVQRIIERAAGNPLLLEELARAVGQRGDEQFGGTEDTISALMHARLQSLGFDARQILRAGSVFGPVFWLDGVVALRKRGSSAALVREWLEELIDQELVVRRPTSRYPGEEEYEFHHLSIRDAAYGMLTEEDTVAAHRSVARWLSERGESNSYILAEHFRLGQELSEAVRFYVEAGRQAFARNEFEAVREITDRALACAEGGELQGSELQGSLELLRAETEACLGRHAEASRFAFRAMADLTEGTPSWLAAAGEASLASARIGEHGRVLEVIEHFDEMDLGLSGGGVELMGIIRAAIPLASTGFGGTALEVLDSVERALQAIADRNPDARGPYHSARALRALCTGELATTLFELEAASREFESAGSLRTAWEHRASAGYTCLELGMLMRGEGLLMEVIRTTEGVGLHHLNAVAKHNLGRRLAEVGRIDEGRALERSALKAFQNHGNRRMEGLTHAFLGRIALEDGDPLEAELHARRGVELLERESGSKIVALSTLAQVLLHVDRPHDAMVYAQQAFDQLQQLVLVHEGESLTRLAYAEALWGCGRREQALAAIAEAHANLLERAEDLGAADMVKRDFLHRVSENAAILQHAQEWPKAPS